MLLKSARGFSLIELTISMGLMGVIMLGALAITKSNDGVGDSFQLRDELEEISNFVRFATNKVGSCGLKIDTQSGTNEFSNQNIPKEPTGLNNSPVAIPVDLYLVRETSDPLAELKSLKARFASNSKLRITNMELVLPEVVNTLPDGERATRGLIVVHMDKKVGRGEFHPLTPLKVETILDLAVTGTTVKLNGCGNTWDVFSNRRTLPNPGPIGGHLDNGDPIVTNLGKHSVCAIKSRALRTGETKTGVWPDREFRPMAQRANFRCAVVPRETGEWVLEVDADRERGATPGDGRPGYASCSAFCI